MQWMIPGVVGATIGSFMNVAIYRIPRNMSLFHPHSHCTHCNAPIRWYDNVPIVSYLILRGRCRRCNHRIPIRYIIVEFMAALSTAGVINVYGFGVSGAGYTILAYVLIVVAFIDLEHLIIPNELIALGLAAGLLFLLISRTIQWHEALLGGLLMGGFLYATGLFGRLVFRKESMGLGDVKLGAMTGIFIGWELGVVTLFLAFLGAGTVGLAGLVTGKMKFGQRVPFGPFLSFAAIAVLFLGDRIIELYPRG